MAGMPEWGDCVEKLHSRIWDEIMIHNKCLHCNKQSQGDGKEQQYYTNRSAIEYSTTFSTQSGTDATDRPDQIYQTTVSWVTGRRRPTRHHLRITMRRMR
jgi:hypothetical protein